MVRRRGLLGRQVDRRRFVDLVADGVEIVAQGLHPTRREARDGRRIGDEIFVQRAVFDEFLARQRERDRAADERIDEHLPVRGARGVLADGDRLEGLVAGSVDAHGLEVRRRGLVDLEQRVALDRVCARAVKRTVGSAADVDDADLAEFGVRRPGLAAVVRREEPFAVRVLAAAREALVGVVERQRVDLVAAARGSVPLPGQRRRPAARPCGARRAATSRARRGAASCACRGAASCACRGAASRPCRGVACHARRAAGRVARAAPARRPGGPPHAARAPAVPARAARARGARFSAARGASARLTGAACRPGRSAARRGAARATRASARSGARTSAASFALVVVVLGGSAGDDEHGGNEEKRKQTDAGHGHG